VSSVAGEERPQEGIGIGQWDLPEPVGAKPRSRHNDGAVTPDGIRHDRPVFPVVTEPIVIDAFVPCARADRGVPRHAPGFVLLEFIDAIAIDATLGYDLDDQIGGAIETLFAQSL
jgi:hypothetical protein